MGKPEGLRVSGSGTRRIRQAMGARAWTLPCRLLQSAHGGAEEESFQSSRPIDSPQKDKRTGCRVSGNGCEASVKRPTPDTHHPEPDTPSHSSSSQRTLAVIRVPALANALPCNKPSISLAATGRGPIQPPLYVRVGTEIPATVPLGLTSTTAVASTIPWFPLLMTS